jgi:ribose-phosphate pyrophosphokinase
MADLMSTAGANHLIGLKFHSDQEQGFFNCSVDNLNTNKLFADYFRQKKIKDLVVVSPDAGGAKDAKKFADLLGAELAIIHKTRYAHNKADVTHVVGNVKGRTCVMYDDMIDTAGSVEAGIKALRNMGADKDIYLAATHAIFSHPAKERLMGAGFKEVVVTNSTPITKDKMFKNLKVLSVAPLLAKIIENVHQSKSVTEVML